MCIVDVIQCKKEGKSIKMNIDLTIIVYCDW